VLSWDMSGRGPSFGAPAPLTPALSAPHPHFLSLQPAYYRKGPPCPQRLCGRPSFPHSCALFLALSREGCTLLHRSEAHLFFFQPFAHSLRVYRGWHPQGNSHFGIRCVTAVVPALCPQLVCAEHRGVTRLPAWAGHSSLSPLQSALTAEVRVGFQGLHLQTLSRHMTAIEPKLPFAKSRRIRTWPSGEGWPS
jgi:hypothetical protein